MSLAPIRRGGARVRQQINALLPLPRPRNLILVAGMPKSGTTAIARLLGELTGKTVCSDPLHQLDQAGVPFRQPLFEGSLNLEQLWRSHRQVFAGPIVKDPNFPLLLPQLQDMFPQARVLVTVRDPRDNLRSILDRLGIPGHPDQAGNALARVQGTWGLVLRGSCPAMPGRDHLEHLAWRWRRSYEPCLALDQRERLILRYEDFNADKEGQIRRAAQRLGLPARHDISHRVNVSFQPKGKAVTDFEAYFGHDALQRILHIVQPLLAEFGYE